MKLKLPETLFYNDEDINDDDESEETKPTPVISEETPLAATISSVNTEFNSGKKERTK